MATEQSHDELCMWSIHARQATVKVLVPGFSSNQAPTNNVISKGHFKLWLSKEQRMQHTVVTDGPAKERRQVRVLLLGNSSGWSKV